MKTKLLSLLVALFATTAIWAYDFIYNGLYYNITSKSDKTVGVTYHVYKNGDRAYTGRTSANIPTTISYDGTTYSVTSIGQDAFRDCTSLTSITIPNSVTSIGYGAFSGCTGFTSITIPNNVTEIDRYAFYGCTGLTSITIPNSVESIGNYAFRNCTGLTSIIVKGGNTIYDSRNNCNAIIETKSNTLIAGCQATIIPNSVTSIGKSAFYGCTGLISVTIPNSVTSIEYCAFEGCTGLTSIIIPENVISIGAGAFGYTGLNTVTWNAKFCEYVWDEFYYGVFNSSPITSFTFGESVQRIPAYLLRGLSHITSVVIPNNVLSIEKNAFEGCSELSSLVIGNGVTSIEKDAFAHCTKLTTVTIPNSVLSLSGFNGCTGLTSITIPNGVVNIEEYAFSHCTNLKFVSISTSVTSIRDNAFQGCTGLSSITIPDNVGYLSGFNECTSLSSITIPQGVTHIGNKAFEKCTGLTTITLPNKVTDIGNNAFSSCTGLTAIAIPNEVASIGNKAFSGCTGLTAISIPHSVTSIGYGVFYGCTNLHNIKVMAHKPPTCGNLELQSTDTCYVPCGTKDAYESVKWGGMSRFYEGTYRVSILPNDVNMGEKIVGEWMCTEDSITATPKRGYHFVRWSDGNTDNPRAVSLTSDTTFMAEFAQVYSGKCGDNLYWKYENGTLFITGTGDMYNYSPSHSPWALFTKQIQSVVCDKGVTSISNYAFQYCTLLNQVSLGDSLHIIGACAFAFCNSLSSICLPNNLPSIGFGAFSECTALGKVVLGKGLTSIEKSAFEKCNKLYDIYCYAIEPPTANTNSFSNYNVYLHVPCENLRNYQLDVLFGSFKYIECIGSDNVDSDGTIVVTPGNNEVEITWPSDGNADTYSILITKAGEEVCTLVFNSNGQLMRIAFSAPARNGAERHAPAAELTQNGYRFTVTGLDSGTKYAYAIDVKDKAGTSLSTYNGTFTTTVNGVPTDVEDVATDASLDDNTPRKVFRDGQVLILRGGKTYTLTGEEVE